VSGSNPAVPVDTSLGNYGAPVQGTGIGGGPGAGQILGADGKVYTDPTYGTNAGGVDVPSIDDDLNDFNLTDDYTDTTLGP